MIHDGWVDHAEKMGEYFRSGLKRLAQGHSLIKDVRGFGLIIGVELTVPGAPVVEACQKKGLLIICAQERVLRFVPPLIVQKGDIDLLLKALEEILSDMEKDHG